MLEVKDLEPTIAQVVLTHGLRERPFRYSLSLQQPSILVELLEMANNRINAEEYNYESSHARNSQRNAEKER